MPNLMIGFLNDITHVSQTAADIVGIARTSVEIQNTIMGGVKTSKSTVKRLKNGEVLRSVTNWFNQKDTFGENSSFAEEDAEFDAGFGTQLDDDTSSTPLDAKSMTDIGVGQTREMYKSAEKTYEAQLHTTAEIINTLEQRSSEIISSLHTTQSHLQHMVKTLDRIVGIQESKLAQRERNKSVFNAYGELTFKSVFDSIMYQFTSSRKSLLKGIMDKTGLTALDAKGHEAITNISNSAFSKLLSAEWFKKIFGDQTRLPGSRDYSAYITNEYVKDPAIFDGMTRKTIVDIIPGYLKAITHAITGTVYHTSNYGTLTTEKPLDAFDMTIDTTFYTQLNQRFSETISSESNNDDATVDIISKIQSILVSQYIFYVYKNGIQTLNPDDLANGGIKSIHQHIAILFSNQTGKKYSYWIKMLNYIETKMAIDKQYRTSFARSVNSGFQRLDAAAKEAVNSGNVRTTQYTRKMFDQHANDLIGYDNKYAAFEGKTPRYLIKHGFVTEEELPEKYRKNMDKPIDSLADFHNELRKSAYDTSGKLLNELVKTKYAYLNGIFERLNTGVNVFFVLSNYKDDDAVPEINTRALHIPYPASTDKIKIDISTPQQNQENKQDKLTSGAKKIVQSVKNNGIIQSITSAVSGEIDKTKADVIMFKDMAVDAVADKARRSLLDDDIKRLSNSGNEQDNKDVTTIKAVMSGMQTSAEDGDTKGDLSSLKDLAAEIEDPEAKKRVNDILQSTIERSSKKSKPNSILGKAILLVFGAFKTIINKATSALSTLFGRGIKWVTKQLKSSGKKIVTGAIAFKEGLLGKKDSDQKGLIRDTIAWGKSKVDKAKQKVSDVKNSESSGNLRTAAGHLKDAAKSVGGMIADNAKDKFNAIKPKLQSFGEKARNTFVNVAGTIGGHALIMKDNISEKWSKAKDKFSNTSFGKGFMSAFEDEKPKITSTSLFDKRAADINDLIKDSTSTSFFATLIQMTKEYTESLVDFVEYIAGDDEEESKKKIDERRKQREEAERKKKEEEEKKKKAEEERKKKEAEEAAKKKASAKSPIKFDLGKMCGGLMKILQGIMKSVGEVVKTMTGLMAIMNIVEDILEKSLKPLNKVFFQIVHLLKPIVKMVTQILKTVVESIVEIVKTLINLIQPVLDAIEPIIESIFSSLKPILEMVTGVVDILVVPMTAIMKVIVVPMLKYISNVLQMITGIVQVGLGIILTGAGGWLIAIGSILKFLTFGIFGGSTKDTGKQLFNTGKNMVVSGAKSYVKGYLGNLVAPFENIKNNIQLLTGTDDEDEEDDDQNKRKKNTELHGSALEGVYGSGDEDDLYSFSDDIKESLSSLRGVGNKFLKAFTPDDEDEDITNGAFKELQKISKRIVGVFTGEEDDTIDEKLARETNKQSGEQTAYEAADMTDEERQKVETTAWEKFQKDHPARDGETMTDYKARYDKSYKADYEASATREYLKEKNQKALNGEDGGAMSLVNSSLGDDGMISTFQSGMEKTDDSVQSGQFAEMVQNSKKGKRSSSGEYDEESRSALSKADLITSAAEIFEAYQKTNPALTYSNAVWKDSITTRSGITRKIRPDCSGTMSAAIQNLGYVLKENGKVVGEVGIRSGSWGTQSSNTLIYDSESATTPSADWKVMDYSKSALEPGDITAFPPPPGQASGHVTMPIANLSTTPHGLDGGCGIQKSPAAAVAYLEGEDNVPWVFNGGMDRMKKIWRFLGRKATTTRKKKHAKGTGADRALRAASEVFLAAKEAQERDHGPYGHGAYIKNLKFDDGMTIDMYSAMCTGTQAAIVKRMGFYLPKPAGKSYSATYQGDYAMGWANGTPSGWGINNPDGHPNIYDRDGHKSEDWIVTNDGSYQAGDITLPGTAWGNKSQTMWHAHMAAFQYGGRWYGFNGGDPKNNPQSVKGQNLAKFYLEHGRMPRDGDDININDYNGDGYLQNHGGKTGVVIRYVGEDTGGDYYDDDYEETTTTTTKKKKTKKKSSSGGSVEAQIYDYLTSKGMSGIGAAGMMGCFKYESGMQPNNLENTFQSKWGYGSGTEGDKKYTSDVNSKRESEKQFVNSRGNPGTAGYGLPQFTAVNVKQDLYDRTVKKGKSIDSIDAQMDSILSVMSKAKYKNTTLAKAIKNASSPTEANKLFLWRYEAGTGFNSDEAVAKRYPWMGMSGINNRHKAAEEYYDMFGGGETPSIIPGADDYDLSYMDELSSDAMSGAELEDYMYDGLSDIVIEDPTTDASFTEYALSEIIPDEESDIIIPPLQPVGMDDKQSRPIVINQISLEQFDLNQYVGDILVHEYDVEATHIKELVDEIFTELPEYLEDDDDDDEFSEEDDLIIQQLASAFL